MNLFRNGDFNLDIDGSVSYEQSSGLRLPHWWRLGYIRQPDGDWRADDGGVSLPLEGQTELPFEAPEVRLPALSFGPLVIGGAWRPVWWWLEQDVTMAAGEYRLAFDVSAQAADVNPLACECRFRVGAARTVWQSLIGSAPLIETVITVGEVTMPVGIEVRGRYGLEHNFVRLYRAALTRIQPASVPAQAAAYAPVDWRGVLPADAVDDGLIELGGVDELTYIERLADSAITAGLQIRYLARQMRAGNENRH